MNEEHAVRPHKHKSFGNHLTLQHHQFIKELVAGIRGPRSMYSEATATAGGMHSCDTTFDLPQNIEQVKNGRRKKRQREFMNFLDVAQRVSYVKGLQ